MGGHLRSVDPAGFKATFYQYAMNSSQTAANYALKDVLQDKHVENFQAASIARQKGVNVKKLPVASLMINKMREIEDLTREVHFSSKPQILQAKKTTREVFMHHLKNFDRSAEMRRFKEAYPFAPVCVMPYTYNRNEETGCLESRLE
jgi:hypothetical protein